MSDATTKGEIEDVLSSIRKLVTEGETPGNGPRLNGGKLVLTPDFRVDEAAPDATPKTGAASGAVPAEDDLVVPSDLATPPPEGADLEREVAELEAALLGHKAPPPPAAAPKDSEPAYDAWEPAEDRKAPVFARQHSEVEVADAEVASEEAVKDAEVVMLPPGKLDIPAAVEASHPIENVGTPDLESLLDENELRALVAEVLREELKGPLGERITRNVRKLVRREIVQALSSLDLE
jgi:hypothetical protein